MRGLALIAALLIGGCTAPSERAASSPPTVAPEASPPATSGTPMAATVGTTLRGTDPFAVCGRLVSHSAATDSAAGRLDIGTRSFVLAPGTILGNAGIEVAPGRDLCIVGSRSVAGPLIRYTARSPEREGRYCGIVLGVAQRSARIAWHDGDLDVALSEDLSVPAVGERVCYVGQVTGSGDLVATAADPPRGKLEMDWPWACGRVTAYETATATAPGRIRIGTWERAIGAGIRYTGDPAGDRTDRTSVGKEMCLTGTVDRSGSLIEYLTQGMHSTIAIAPVGYRPQTSASDGYVLVTARSRGRLVIPAGASVGDLSRGYFCFRLAVDTTGDAILAAPCVDVPPATPGPAPGTATTAIGVATLDPQPGQVVARAASAIPRDRAFVPWRDGREVVRLWLIDLSGAQAPQDIAATRATQGLFTDGFADLAPSADGSTITFRALTSDAGEVYSLDLRTGRSERLAGIPSRWASILFSPDGSSYAYSDVDQVLKIRGADGRDRAIAQPVARNMVGGDWRARAWSPDGAWLAIGRSAEAVSELAIVRSDGTGFRAIGRGGSVSWRERAPEVVISSSRGPFGGKSYVDTYDLASGARRELEAVTQGDSGFSRAVWHPSLDRFAYLRTSSFDNGEGGAWIRDLTDSAARRLTARRGTGSVQWSADGARLYELSETVPGRLDVIDAFAGANTARICSGGCR